MKEDWTLTEISATAAKMEQNDDVTRARILRMAVGVLAGIPNSDYISVDVTEGVKASAS